MRKLPGILLVDDDSTSNFLTQRLLRRLALADQLLEAGNGAEGLRVLQHVLATPASADAGPWLVLLDVNMPVLNGFGFLEAYQQLPAAQRQRVAVVVLTTSLHNADLERLQQLPIAGLLSKPLTETKVATIRRDYLRALPPHPAPATGVFQLLYSSHATYPLTEAEIHHLLSQARQANAAAQITGVLLHRAGRFVQVLEGAEADVRAVYARIEQDPRHTQVVAVGEARGRPRYFAHWRMALGSNNVPAVARLFDAVLAHELGGQGAPLNESLLQDVGAGFK